MNQAILYRRNGQKKIWLALGCAIAIHIGAIAMSAGRVEHSSLSCVLPGTEIEVTVDDSETRPPPLDLPVPETPKIPDDDSFRDETPPPQPRHRTAPIAPIPTRNGVTNRRASFHSLKALTLWAPKPPYPYEARRRQITGSGTAALEVDPASGSVTEAAISQSTGSTILDNSIVSALRRWRFKAGTPVSVQVPITFTLTGASY